eukprot:895798-Pelagomonas_calceolata.AAC.2
MPGKAVSLCVNHGQQPALHPGKTVQAQYTASSAKKQQAVAQLLSLKHTPIVFTVKKHACLPCFAKAEAKRSAPPTV